MCLYGGPKSDFVYAVAVDASGSIYTAGSFEKEATIGSTHLITPDPELGYLSDAYLIRWDSAGNVIWARQMAVLPMLESTGWPFHRKATSSCWEASPTASKLIASPLHSPTPISHEAS
jgi:hypothetical protein